MAVHRPSEQPLPEQARAISEIDPTEQGYVTEDIFRPVGKSDKTGKIKLVKREDMLRVEDRVKMTSGSTYVRVDYGTELTSYNCEKYGAEAQIDDEERESEDTFDVENKASKRAQGTVMLKMEDEASDIIFDETTWPTDDSDLYTGVGTAWSDTSAPIIKDVIQATEKVNGNTGLDPNALILNKSAMNNMLFNDDIISRFSNDDLVTPAQLRASMARLFDLDYLIVAGASKNTANQGAAGSMSRIWSGDYAMVARVAQTNDPAEPCIARGVRWDAMDDTGYEVVMYREPQTDSDVVKVRRYLDLRLIDKYLGHRLDITGTG